MSKPDPIVSEVSRLASEGQPNSYDRAYQALQTGFDKFLDNERLCSPNQQVDQMKADQYWNNINQELSQRGLLPGLSVAYLRANFERLDTQGRKSGDPAGPDGFLTHSEIRQEEGRNQVFARQFDQQEGKRDFFFEVAKMSNNGNTRKVIEQEDIDKYLRKQDKTNAKHEWQEAERQSMAPLFQESGCANKPLIEYLNSKTVNGRVTVNEMNRFLDECDRRRCNPDGTFNQQNADYVQKILNGEMDWNRAGDGFNINKLARRGGFDALNMKGFNSHEELEDNYNAASKVFAEKTAPNENNITPKSKCEELEEQAAAKAEEAHRKDAEKAAERQTHGDKGAEGCPDVPDGLFTVRHGEGYWHVAKRLLSLDPAYKPSNNEIMHCMTLMMAQNTAHFAEQYPGYTPMLRPGDVVHCDLNQLCAQSAAARKVLRK